MSNNLIVKNHEDLVFSEAFLTATKDNPHDVPFAALQSASFRHDLTLVEQAAPENRTAIGVGIGGEEVALDVEHATMNLNQLALARGLETGPVAAISNPSAGPTLAAAAGTSDLEAGWVGVAYAYVNEFGRTKRSDIVGVQLTEGVDPDPDLLKINVTALVLPAGVTSVDWFVTLESFDTEAEAEAAPVRFLENNDGEAFSITEYPAATAPLPSAVNTLGTAMTQALAHSDSTPTGCDVVLRSPEDGSDFQLLLYNCVIVTHGQNLGGVREFVRGSINIKSYGRLNESTGKYEYYKIRRA